MEVPRASSSASPAANGAAPGEPGFRATKSPSFAAKSVRSQATPAPANPSSPG